MKARSLALLRRAALAIIFGVVLIWAVEGVWDVVDPVALDACTDFEESRRVVDAQGRLLRIKANSAGEYLLRVPLDEISPFVIQALIAAEDRRFDTHGGIDLLAAARAAVTNLATGRIVSGASTVTMQLARIAEPHERSFAGKFAEARRARQIERALPKHTILELYLNRVPIGGRLRGIEAGARYWFGKPARDLSAAEAATLIALLPAPSRRAPDRNSRFVRDCRDDVLDAMREAGHLTLRAWREALAEPMNAFRHPWPFHAPEACDVLLSESSEIVVKASIDVEAHDRVRRIVLEQATKIVDGIAVVVLDRKNGDIVDLIGSKHPEFGPINAALRRRDAASTVKPFLYALAVDAGIAGRDVLLEDEPVAYGRYRPRDADQRFEGRIRTEDALATSRNVPAVRLLEAIGPERFLGFLDRLGIAAESRDLHLAAALGTSRASPLELARAYLRFSDEENPVLNFASRKEALRMLERLQPPEYASSGRRMAFKTGTSSGRRDAWSVGVTDRYVIVVWLGRLDGRGAASLTGARHAAPLLGAIATVYDERHERGVARDRR